MIDEPFMHWAIWDSMFKAQQAFEGVLANMPLAARWLAKCVVFPFGRPYRVPSDELGRLVARLLIQPGNGREHLTEGTFIPKVAAGEFDILNAMEYAMGLTPKVEEIEQKIRQAQKAGRLPHEDQYRMLDLAFHEQIIVAEEKLLLTQYYSLRDKIIAVDDFPQDFDLKHKG
jgi:acyl-CoA dehydrogenase